MAAAISTHNPAWWKSAIVYQIYPASFQDSNGDGTGDLPGITSKLDYLKELGVDMIWLCPIYKSPLADMGYDISDYEDINPAFGTLSDWEELLSGLHRRNMKLIMDLVINHTSEEHEWFKSSRSTTTNPKRDWYIWRPPKIVDGVQKPPNNWRSIFGGSAWEWDESTKEYYLHIFAKEQPDLNWENSDMREAVQKMMSHWLDKGIDGFRLDAINFISKSTGLPDAPVADPNEDYQDAFVRFNHGPHVHEYLQELYEKVLCRYDVFTVGETAQTPPEEALKYIRQDRFPRELQMIFNFDHLDLYGGFHVVPPARDLPSFKRIITTWQQFMHVNGGWNSIYLENHDHPRSIGRFMSEEPAFRELSAKALCLMSTSLSGTIFVYQGQEIGMINVPTEWGIEEYQDIATQQYYSEQLKKLRKSTSKQNPDMSGIMGAIRRVARDNSRTPMQWDSSPTGGFTTGKPWMRASPDTKTCNVEAQLKESSSVLSFWRKMIATRKQRDVLIYGQFVIVDFPSAETSVFSYIRQLGDNAVFVAINFTEETVQVDMQSVLAERGSFKLKELIVGTYPDEDSQRRLRAYEGAMYELEL